jgi:hypothetical protein
MIEDAIAKWRGIARWPQTEATVYSYELLSDGVYDDGPPSARIIFYYQDAMNSRQSGEFIADSLTSLYNLKVNDTFQIQFNPRKPSQFYCSERTSWFTQTRVVFWVGAASFAIVFAVLLLLHHL